MSDTLLKQIDEMLARRIGTLEESLGDKLDLLAEGQQMLSERMERIESRVESVETLVTRQSGQIAGIASDIISHRRDTEAHHGVWQVKEN